MNLSALLADPGISESALTIRGLRRCEEPAALEVVQTDADGRQHWLAPAAARSWRRMAADARAVGLSLTVLSAFRSVERQAERVRRKIATGSAIADILSVTAPPGYSEHHTGMAVDIGTEDGTTLDSSFEHTAAFAWLQQHAASYGFHLSHPRGNPQGYTYEPWHWRFTDPDGEHPSVTAHHAPARQDA